MGRQRRPDLPGTIFHLTARIIHRRHWLTPRLRTAFLGELARAMPRSRMRLLAVAVMSNHIHIVAQQGQRPLSSLMQPLLRRVALRLQHAHDVQGPVFWRPYGSAPCMDPSHARNAIVYTHLNPVRAGLCDEPAGYRWSSHTLYAGASGATAPTEVAVLRPVLDPCLALPLFATAGRRSTDALRADYRAFVDGRVEMDRALEGGGDSAAALGPSRDAGPWQDHRWSLTCSPLFHTPVLPGPRDRDAREPRVTPDLATLVRATLAAEAPAVPLREVRGRGGGRERTRLRHRVIRRLHAAGYRNVDIARFLDLSASGVSYFVHKPEPE